MSENVSNIPRRVNSALCALRPSRLLLLSMAASAIIGFLDIFIGKNYSMSLFYVAPLSVAAYYCGRACGLKIALLSIFPMFIKGLQNGRVHIHPLLYSWDISIQLGFMLAIVIILSSLRIHVESESRMARTDYLTGVFNRRAFREQLQFCISLSGRTTDIKTFALAYVDLDDFKAVNEYGGHQLGDEVLCKVADTLRHSVRSSDVVARLGGDEFAVLMLGVNPHHVPGVLNTFREVLKGTLTAPAVTCSIGCVVFPAPVHDIDDIITQADALMFRTKRMGKNSLQLQYLVSN